MAFSLPWVFLSNKVAWREEVDSEEKDEVARVILGTEISLSLDQLQRPECLSHEFVSFPPAAAHPGQ